MTSKRLYCLAASALLFASPLALAAPLATASMDPTPPPQASLTADADAILGQDGGSTAAITSESALRKITWIETVVVRSMGLLGKPYRWGGSTPEQGFDCSGLVSYVLRGTIDVQLPRNSSEMARVDAERIANRSDLATGDLVFFGRRGRINHVGIYLGDGQFVHAPSRGKAVQVSALSERYWNSRYIEALRMAPGAA